MYIIIRDLNPEDIDIYKTCFSSKEFKCFIYGHKEIDVDSYFNEIINQTRFVTESYVVLYNMNEHMSGTCVVGFCNFVKYDKFPFEITKETFAINGGCLPCLFNKGVGVYACASVLYFFFARHRDSVLYASTFEENERSSKMLNALGFEQLCHHLYNKKHFVLGYESFNDCLFAKKVMSRINLIASC